MTVSSAPSVMRTWSAVSPWNASCKFDQALLDTSAAVDEGLRADMRED